VLFLQNHNKRNKTNIKKKSIKKVHFQQKTQNPSLPPYPHLSGRLISIHLAHIQIHDNQIDISLPHLLIAPSEQLDHRIAVLFPEELDRSLSEPQFLQNGLRELDVG
jgi:hypothetical protein